ncbi:hypothetical protein GCM10007108_11830 [Thermogymnomonas acidicola]|uniref:Methyltransferase domain-containing protein n=1 Tax=Thermogymnomonas acidicola TaxID=399579 RepID=A0AA37F9S8_9ARCH|nr:class I SAM-dependent methyltransferase [Thermogymnomonas acidicola]GGM75551.1 hypothetical protein GCM10007108_11830 [Thermogymnomonas acidicola]
MGVPGVDFGQYHHSTREESEALRQRIALIFSRAFSYLEESRFSPSSVVDLGAGLGFLTHLVLSRFPRARATLVDTFSGHGLRGASVDRARANMEALGYAQRVDFYVADVRSLPFSDASFDMAVTSLVFHNLSDGVQRAFSEMQRVVRPLGYMLYGDIFIELERHRDYLSGCRVMQKYEERLGEEMFYTLYVIRKDPD